MAFLCVPFSSKRGTSSAVERLTLCNTAIKKRTMMKTRKKEEEKKTGDDDKGDDDDDNNNSTAINKTAHNRGSTQLLRCGGRTQSCSLRQKMACKSIFADKNR